MNVRLLHASGCGSRDETLARLREVLAREGILGDVEILEIGSEEEAGREGLRGSPTIQIDGRDIDPSRRSDSPSMG